MWESRSPPLRVFINSRGEIHVWGWDPTRLAFVSLAYALSPGTLFQLQKHPPLDDVHEVLCLSYEWILAFKIENNLCCSSGRELQSYADFPERTWLVHMRETLVSNQIQTCCSGHLLCPRLPWLPLFSTSPSTPINPGHRKGKKSEDIILRLWFYLSAHKVIAG